mmetsp:Transcript_113414/g.353572  ORF Transcript_113414/g.353572 Transcript_113414/m.353572 type:complete len:223 (+) Transcript_113414:254-922(+)
MPVAVDAVQPVDRVPDWPQEAFQLSSVLAHVLCAGPKLLHPGLHGRSLDGLKELPLETRQLLVVAEDHQVIIRRLVVWLGRFCLRLAVSWAPPPHVRGLQMHQRTRGEADLEALLLLAVRLDNADLPVHRLALLGLQPADFDLVPTAHGRRVSLRGPRAGRLPFGRSRRRTRGVRRPDVQALEVLRLQPRGVGGREEDLHAAALLLAAAHDAHLPVQRPAAL